ncbi:unnamed protein product [Chironomus riparius]|uniref:Uncharacterized protein n=1 Tax=Chironomus riparius TaxID=315576 RepID=A0A9N9RIH9_9DIPT|nr:unnamed protein product [Chironomus riparius]
MSQLSVITVMQKELDAISRRRRSLESNVSYLEDKINVVNQNLEKNGNKMKMMSLIEFLEIEKQRVQEHKLNKVNEKAKLLKDKIINIKKRQRNLTSCNNIKEILSSQLLSNVHLVKPNLSRPKSFQQPNRAYNQANRKYQSLPTSLSHTENEEFESFNLLSNQQKERSSTHLPMCMSMKVCKECAAIRDFFEKMQNEKVVDQVDKRSPKTNSYDFGNVESPYNVSSKSAVSKVFNDITYGSTKESKESTKASTANEDQNQYCMRCRAVINEVNNQVETSQQKEFHMYSDINQTSVLSDVIVKSQSKCIDEDEETEIFEPQASFSSQKSIDVISASILATCESYAFCECCKNNLTNITMLTPSPSIVEMACISHENCTKCTKVLLSSRDKSLSLTKPVSYENLCTKSPQSSKSGMSLKEQDGTVKLSSKILLEQIQKEIEYQNQIIFDTKDQKSKLSILNESDEKLLLLRNMLEIENMKLADIKNLARNEEQKLKELNSWNKPFITENFLKYVE